MPLTIEQITALSFEAVRQEMANRMRQQREDVFLSFLQQAGFGQSQLVKQTELTMSDDGSEEFLDVE